MGKTVTRKTVGQRVIKAIADQLGCEEGMVQPASNFFNDLGADSLDRLEILMALEDEFEVEVMDEVAERIHTVQEAIDFISQLKIDGCN